LLRIAEEPWTALDIRNLIDRELVAIKNENPTLLVKLDKHIGAAELKPGRMGELVDLTSQIGLR